MQRERSGWSRGSVVPVAVVALFAAAVSWSVFGDFRLVVVAVGAAASAELGSWWRRRHAVDPAAGDPPPAPDE
ncbi:hypothetical protein SAMN05660991_01527 [Trujillonella endophytica]|uniref:Uncharacterized protein n=1 Tax=Trujillonella endophytica TaxID=673521 RepID=A0A1H8SA61_9ACTN|nr:hypothetical protein SAMN05660991_01527 [Trujillella endophytica]